MDPEDRKCCCRSAETAQRDARDLERRIVTVTIDTEHCVICNACESICPEVFSCREDGAVLTATAAEHFTAKRDMIEKAVVHCCVEVISVRYADGTTTDPSARS